MRFVLRRLVAVAILAGLPGVSAAQGTEVAFGAFSHDSTLPVEVTAEKLSVDQADGSAVFQGGVVIGQGEMRITAGEVKVLYANGNDATGEIDRLEASGGVTLVSGAEAAEAREAVYSIDSGTIVMTGDVILTQGRNALSSQKLTVNLKSGTGVMEGGVKTILQTGSAP
jgi:lipopolysaccharide export system protein LptA